MHYLSKRSTMSFEDAVAAARQALKRHQLAILAEIDLGEALRRELGVGSRPYLIFSACSPRLAHRAIELDSEIGSILLCNVVVHEHGDGRVEICAADPLTTIGTINHVELISIALELQLLVQRVVDDIEPFPRLQRGFSNSEEAGRQFAHEST
jgi:uncharacterized protein (DUF302 family)